jgi:hypothetical protein
LDGGFDMFWSVFWGEDGELFDAVFECSFGVHTNCDPSICGHAPGTTVAKVGKIPRVTCKPQQSEVMYRMKNKFGLVHMHRLVAAKELPGHSKTVVNNGTQPLESLMQHMCKWANKGVLMSTSKYFTAGCLALADSTEKSLHKEAVVAACAASGAPAVAIPVLNSDGTKKQRATRPHPPTKMLVLEEHLEFLAAHVGLAGADLPLQPSARKRLEKRLALRVDRSIDRTTEEHRAAANKKVAEKRNPAVAAAQTKTSYLGGGRGIDGGQAHVEAGAPKRKVKNVSWAPDSKSGGKGSRQGKGTITSNKADVLRLLRDGKDKFGAVPSFDVDVDKKASAERMYLLAKQVGEWHRGLRKPRVLPTPPAAAAKSSSKGGSAKGKGKGKKRKSLPKAPAAALDHTPTMSPARKRVAPEKCVGSITVSEITPPAWSAPKIKKSKKKKKKK